MEVTSVICDKCGEPVREGIDLAYSLAYDEEKGVGRHARCHTSNDAAFKRANENFDAAFARAKSLLADLKKVVK